MRYVEFGDWARNERDGGCKNFPEGYSAKQMASYNEKMSLFIVDRGI